MISRNELEIQRALQYRAAQEEKVAREFYDTLAFSESMIEKSRAVKDLIVPVPFCVSHVTLYNAQRSLLLEEPLLDNPQRHFLESYADPYVPVLELTVEPREAYVQIPTRELTFYGPSGQITGKDSIIAHIPLYKQVDLKKSALVAPYRHTVFVERDFTHIEHAIMIASPTHTYRGDDYATYMNFGDGSHS